MIILEVLVLILAPVAMLSATALGVHVLLEDSEILGHLKKKLQGPDEVEMLKRTTLELEAEAEKREEMEHWAQRMERAERKLRRLEADEPEPTYHIYPDPKPIIKKFADGARYDFKYPDDKVGTEMRQAREASREFGGEPDQKERLEKHANETSPAINAAREFGETADELGERVERAIHERMRKYKAEIKKRERMEQLERQRRHIPLEVVHRYHSTPSHQRPRKYEAEARKREQDRRIHDLARRTINNEFGIGQERMQRLGPDYEPVQAEVNRILKKATQKTNRRP